MYPMPFASTINSNLRMGDGMVALSWEKLHVSAAIKHLFDYTDEEILDEYSFNYQINYPF